MGIWESRFEELAIFNADKDKDKFTNDYIMKMNNLQSEYNERLLLWAKANGYIVIQAHNPKLKGAALSRPFERLVRREITG